MSIDVMKQALEVLNTGGNEVLPEDYGQMVSEAITALRAAIEQSEKRWVKTYAGGKPNYTTPEEQEPGVTLDASAPLVVQPHPAFQSQPPVQEPVATVTSESGNPNVSMSWWHEPALPVGTNIYTSPQPSKPWVGLTDEEIAEMHNEIKVRLMGTYRTEDIYRAIEAKLKKKNT